MTIREKTDEIKWLRKEGKFELSTALEYKTMKNKQSKLWDYLRVIERL